MFRLRPRVNRKGSEVTMQARKPTCHPDRKHQAKGLCNSCYCKTYAPAHYKNNKELYKKRRAQHYINNKEKCNQYSRQWYLDNKEEVLKSCRKNWLHREYNITCQEYDKLLSAQNGKCAVCDKHQSEIKNRLCIDHCHTSGKIRGLLCSPCNRAIGQLGDTLEELTKVVEYLRRAERETTKAA